jgi:ethanolamine utilization protein EutQ (cupin superfamily)
MKYVITEEQFKTYEHPDDILTIPKGSKITITRGVDQKYCYWGN